MDSDQESVKTVTDEQMDSGRSTCSSMSDQGSDKTMISGELTDSRRSSFMSEQGSVKIETDEQMDSGRSTCSSMSDQWSAKISDSRRSSLMSEQGSFKTIKEESQTHIKDEPKTYIKLEQKTPMTENKDITVSIRGQGNQQKILKISRTASLDQFISEVNMLFGLGPKPGNTYINHNGIQLSGGTQTVEQAGLQNNSSVDLCMRTLGG